MHNRRLCSCHVHGFRTRTLRKTKCQRSTGPITGIREKPKSKTSGLGRHKSRRRHEACFQGEAQRRRTICHGDVRHEHTVPPLPPTNPAIRYYSYDTLLALSSASLFSSRMSRGGYSLMPTAPPVVKRSTPITYQKYADSLPKNGVGSSSVALRQRPLDVVASVICEVVNRGFDLNPTFSGFTEERRSGTTGELHSPWSSLIDLHST